MTLYVGREPEHEQLRQLLRKRSSSLVICKGRRRIGKSTLIAKFGEEVTQFLYFEGLPPREGLTRREQLAAFAERLAAQTSLPKVVLESWPQAFQLLSSAIPTKGWTVLLLDEISWMSIGDRDFAGHLKGAWDNYLSRHPRLIVVVCGSVSSWIDRNILSSPAFMGRCSLVIALEPLPLSACNAFWRGKKVTGTEKLKILAVTGGVPRYLQEIDPSQSAEQNVHRLCFQPSGFLFQEAEQIFHDAFDRRADTYRRIVATLVDGSRTVSAIGAALRHERGGSLSDALVELVSAGFITRDVSFMPRTGKARPRAIRYRLSDNYLRFYLKYIAPRRSQIEKRLYQRAPLEALVSWDTIFGLQLENLVLQSLDLLRTTLQLDRVNVLNAGPYLQPATKRRAGCQIDLLLRTKQAVYVLEIKLRERIDRSVIEEMKEKVRRLEGARDLTVRTGLIFAGELDPRIERDDYFDFIVPFDRLLDG
jgi:uncharacterized protein